MKTTVPLRFAIALLVLGAPLTALCAPSFTVIPAHSGATTGFTDTVAGDHEGGWTDEGPNDIAVIPSGSRDYAGGIRFLVASEKEHPGRTCIVLGGPAREWMPQEAALPALGSRGTPAKGPRLYLLHAAAGMGHPDAHGTVGTLTVAYEDGAETNIAIRAGIDAADWQRNESYANAAMAWTDYNQSTQVALFASKFPLEDKPLRELRFRAGDSTWMVVAATIGDDTPLRPIRQQMSLTRHFSAPTPPESFPAFAAGLKPRNVIFCFGDGMGQGALAVASMHLWHAPGRLVMQQMPHATLVATHSANQPVTDSAASGTALACGRKTNNGFVGLDPDGRPLVSLAALAHARGLGAAVLSNDALVGATPASFYAHVPSRRERAAIAAQVPEAGFDVLVGNAGHTGQFRPVSAGGLREDGRDIIAEMEEKGYAFADTPEALASIPADRKAFGLLGGDFYESDTALADAAEFAWRRLGTNPAGFFLFCEGTRPDHGGHGNNPETLVSGVVQVDWLVRKALDFAIGRGDTLVLVTADHETGGVQTVAGSGGATPETIHFASFGHTGAHVPLYAYGPGADRFTGVMDNTDVAKTIAFLLGLSFPEP